MVLRRGIFQQRGENFLQGSLFLLVRRGTLNFLLSTKKRIRRWRSPFCLRVRNFYSFAPTYVGEITFFVIRFNQCDRSCVRLSINLALGIPQPREHTSLGARAPSSFFPFRGEKKRRDFDTFPWTTWAARGDRMKLRLEFQYSAYHTSNLKRRQRCPVLLCGLGSGSLPKADFAARL